MWDDAAVRADENSGSESDGAGARAGARDWNSNNMARVKEACAALGLRRLSATPVVHCAHSFALVGTSILRGPVLFDCLL